MPNKLTAQEHHARLTAQKNEAKQRIIQLSRERVELEQAYQYAQKWAAQDGPHQDRQIEGVIEKREALERLNSEIAAAYTLVAELKPQLAAAASAMVNEARKAALAKVNRVRRDIGRKSGEREKLLRREIVLDRELRALRAEGNQALADLQNTINQTGAFTVTSMAGVCRDIDSAITRRTRTLLGLPDELSPQSFSEALFARHELPAWLSDTPLVIPDDELTPGELEPVTPVGPYVDPMADLYKTMADQRRELLNSKYVPETENG